MSELIFADATVCGIPVPNVSYIYVSTNCTNFDTSWIQVSWHSGACLTNFPKLVPPAGLDMQLDRDRDPIGCHIYKAYNYGAAIGVIVAVVLFLALLIGGWIFWYRRRSRQVCSSFASLLPCVTVSSVCCLTALNCFLDHANRASPGGCLSGLSLPFDKRLAYILVDFVTYMHLPTVLLQKVLFCMHLVCVLHHVSLSSAEHLC